MEALLADFKGVLVVVSHDRQFVNATAERLFVLCGDGLVRLFDGTYSEVRQLTIQQSSAVQQKAMRSACLPSVCQQFQCMCILTFKPVGSCLIALGCVWSCRSN